MENTSILKSFATFIVASMIIVACGVTKNSPTAALPTQADMPSTATSLPSQKNIPNAGDVTISPKDGMRLHYVPAGAFMMGAYSGSIHADEAPVHYVALDAFWIDETEITNELYVKCVDAGKCGLPNNVGRFHDPAYAHHPAADLSWENASAYCAWAGRNLPSEAQWEKAARWNPFPTHSTSTPGMGKEGDGQALNYPWGNEAPNNTLLNYNAEIGHTTEVGHYPKGVSPYGAFDMAGNVLEWVDAWYDVYPGGDATFTQNFGQKYHVTRGGSWYDSADDVRSAHRNWFMPDYGYNTIGFRCALTP